jgi:putative heme-binding domain-containing protein
MKWNKLKTGGFMPAFFNTALTAVVVVASVMMPSGHVRASDPETLKSIVELMVQVDDPQFHLDLLKGMAQALEGRRSVPEPEGWPAAEKMLKQSPSGEVRTLARQLGVKFGSGDSMRDLRETVRNPEAEVTARVAALETLVRARDSEIASSLPGLLNVEALRIPVLNAMSGLYQDSYPASILSHYPQFSVDERKIALNTLAARESSALALVRAVQDGQVPSRDLRAELVRQLRQFEIPEIAETLNAVWGKVENTPEAKLQEIEKYRRVYQAGGSLPGDASRGRAVYIRLCYQCHELFESGGNIGPSLTGSNRADLGYILENIVHPNAVVPNDYRTTTIETTDFRVLSGILKQRTADSITLATVAGNVVVPQDEIESMDTAAISMMPEGLLQGLDDQEVRDLIYYLKSPAQAPVMATSETAGFFFNSKDLAFWNGNPELWQVRNGEIIGSAPDGLQRNEFLTSEMKLADFILECEVKLTPNSENSGIQFRSQPIGDGEVRGYQADIGAGWWGKLYEEHGRALLWDKSGEKAVKPGEWNHYKIHAEGHHIRTWINGVDCVDLVDQEGALSGVVALQLHSGGPMEVRFRNFRLKVLAP